MRAQHHQATHSHSEEPTSARWPLIASLGLACAAAFAPASELVRSTEADYIADRDNGWMEQMLNGGQVPTRAVLPPEAPALHVLPDGAVAIDELRRFRQGRDVTKCLVTALGAPAVTTQRENSVTLAWPNLVVDPTKQALFTLELTLSRSPGGEMRVGSRLLPAARPVAQASTETL